MPQPDHPPSFHLRLPSDLKDQLQDARGRNSLNREIVERLERSFEPDPAMQLAEILRPFLAAFTETDRVKLLGIVGEAVDILAKKQK